MVKDSCDSSEIDCEIRSLGPNYAGVNTKCIEAAEGRITTRQVCEKYITDLLTIPFLSGRLFFISVNFSDSHKIKIRGKLKSYITVSQKSQYQWLQHKMRSFEYDSDFFHGCTIFEQTKKGNMHFHMVIHSDMAKHDIACSLYDKFEIKSKDELQHAVHITEIDDYQGIYNYIFQKTSHAYENVDWNTFPPIIYELSENKYHTKEIIPDSLFLIDQK